MEQEIDLEVKSLETCAYSSNTFREILGKIQKAVDNLSLHSYSNLPQWVAKLDEEVRNGFFFICFFEEFCTGQEAQMLDINYCVIVAYQWKLFGYVHCAVQSLRYIVYKQIKSCST